MRRPAGYALIYAVAAMVLVFCSCLICSASPRMEPKAQQGLKGFTNRMPLHFEKNLGQAPPQVEYLARNRGYAVFITNSGLVLKTRGKQSPARVARLRLEGANPGARAMGLGQLPGKANYFKGAAPQKWRTNIPTYSKVKISQVYPGIDLVYYGNRQGRLEWDFVVAPGADPGKIRFSVQGAGAIAPNARGGLNLGPDGLSLGAPKSFQGLGSTKRPVASRYRITAQSVVAVEVGEYDHGKPLVIDPALVYSTYLGGRGEDLAWNIALDASGNAYVTGYTYSTDFPTVNALKPSMAEGDDDAFVAKISADGGHLVYSTYLGGTRGDDAHAITVDESGNAYLTGITLSNDFPVVNAGQASYGGGEHDAFVAKLNAEGNQLVYSTYLGGPNGEDGHGIAVDSEGNAYVAGVTGSADYFPLVNPAQSSHGGKLDAFAAKIGPKGLKLIYSTYLGGSGNELLRDLAIDSHGNAYLTGYTASTDFPTANPVQSSYGGGEYDAFVAKLNPEGNQLVYSTYLGGSHHEDGIGIAVDNLGCAYVAGDTRSTDFPTANALQPAMAGKRDAFIAKLEADGSRLVYSTYLGGASWDYGMAVDVDSEGNAYFSGETKSTDFPTVNPLQPSNAGDYDAFVAKLDASGSKLIYCTYLGGSEFDAIKEIVTDGMGNVYAAGATWSSDFPTATPLQPSQGGDGDAFVVKIKD